MNFPTPTVNNVATTAPPAYFDEFSSLTLWQNINVNVNSTLQMTSIILPQMKKRKRGAIVNVSSYLDAAAMPLFSLYSASKVRVVSFNIFQ